MIAPTRLGRETGDAPMDEKKLMTIVNLGSAVMVLVLAGAFVAVIRAALNVGAGH